MVGAELEVLLVIGRCTRARVAGSGAELLQLAMAPWPLAGWCECMHMYMSTTDTPVVLCNRTIDLSNAQVMIMMHAAAADGAGCSERVDLYK